MHLLRGLEARGHTCSVWIEDSDGTHSGRSPDDVEASFRDWFGGLSGDVHADFAAWRGADVVLATGWQTVYRVLRLDRARARGYLVQDHEPEFYGTSAERMWAEQTYALGLPAIAASPWLAGVLRERYGARADAFDLGIDHAVYAPVAGVDRRADTVVFYARAVTARRAVPLGVLALARARPPPAATADRALRGGAADRRRLPSHGRAACWTAMRSRRSTAKRRWAWCSR